MRELDQHPPSYPEWVSTKLEHERDSLKAEVERLRVEVHIKTRDSELSAAYQSDLRREVDGLRKMVAELEARLVDQTQKRVLAERSEVERAARQDALLAETQAKLATAMRVANVAAGRSSPQATEDKLRLIRELVNALVAP